MKRALCLGGLVYLGVIAVLYSLQTRVIFPGASTQGQPFAEVRPRPGSELVRLQTDEGESIVALFGPALTASGHQDARAEDRPTMIFFYGNAMCLNDAQAEFDEFRRLGLNVLIPEYVGYGMSSGSPSEKGCQATALAAYEYLVRKRGVAPERLVAAGWSLGGSVAVDVAAHRPVAGLIIFSTFTSAVDMGRRVLPLAPVSLLVRDRFDSLRKIQEIHCPILIGHGRQDGIVPFWMAERLAAAAGGPVTTLWIDQAEHNDFFLVGGPRIDEAIARFVAHVVRLE